jgi:hypothetical protein
METDRVRTAVRVGYGKIAKGEGSCCGQRASCGGVKRWVRMISAGKSGIRRRI